MNLRFNNLTPKKAEIIGLLCAEGTHYEYYSTYNEFHKNRGKGGKYYKRTKLVRAVEFTNLDKDMLKHFRSLLKEIYGYFPKVTGVKTSLKVRITKNSIREDLLSYTKYGCTKWQVPKPVLNGKQNIKSAFIRGIFDGDGCFSEHDLRLKSVNQKGLQNIAKMLKSMGIRSKVFGPYKYHIERPSFVLVVPKTHIIKYRNLISSNHSRKLQRLDMLGSTAGI